VVSKKENSSASSRKGRTKKVASKPAVIRTQVKAKRAVLSNRELNKPETISQSIESAPNLDVGSSQKSALMAIGGERFRLITIALIVASLIFGIGFKLGDSSNVNTVDQAIETIVESGAKQFDRETLERAAIEGALKATGDEWANYFPKSALEILENESSNSFTGIGVWLAKSRGGAVQITSIQEDSPAALSGLLVGDQVLEVNGTDVRGASLTSVIGLIRGSIGKKIELLVSRDGKKILASLSAERVSIRTVEASQISSQVAYLEIASFATGTAQDVKNSLAKLKFDDGVIIDLRNNPGGVIEEAVNVAELFIGSGVIVSYQVNGFERLFKANNPSPIKVPVILMINRNTASSAEILAGAFQDRNRGVVVGERSYGKGSVQELVTLEDGSRIELTVALYVTPSGRVVEEVGITPDLSVSPNEISIKALQVLGGLASLSTTKKNQQ
jgi:carboxyl-terminal processing protease